MSVSAFFTYLGQSKVILRGIFGLEELLNVLGVLLAGETIKRVLDEVIKREIALEAPVKLLATGE